MSHESWTLSQTLNSSEGFCQGEMVQGFEELGNLFFSSFNSETDHSSKSSHLLFGDFMIFVILQSRVDCIFDIFVFGEEVSNVIGTSSGLNNSQLQSFEAPQCQKAVERTRICSKTIGCEINFAVKFFVFEDSCSHHEIRVTSDIFGQAVIGNISTQKKWRSQVRTAKGIIDNNDNVGINCLNGLCNCLNIDELKGRIGWSFDPNHLSLFPNRLNSIFNFSEIDEFALESMPLVGESSHVSLSSSVDIVTNNDVVTRLQGVEDSGCCSTSTSESDRMSAILNCGKTGFKSLSCRITTA